MEKHEKIKSNLQENEWHNWEDDSQLLQNIDNQIEEMKRDYENNQKSTDKYVTSFAVFNFCIGILGFFPLEDFPFISKIPSVLSFCLGFVVLSWQYNHPLQKYVANTDAYSQLKTLFANYKNRDDIFFKKNESEAKRLLNAEINKIQQQKFVKLRDAFVDTVNQVTNKLVGDKVK